ncbi:tRNA (N6-threonylcarbamoyladenosine(37)-N6)-methyltransferase TrmO [Mameliella alba]|nr:tRNA (N6-threonylcarbamoyladenosine(37)-N6)-methyltransferase TrmO [Mameliella alba]MBY6170888.1 tRNA (N6-threonylcarbamoyladenosine(37)-N6)-methyltransferase TrmO [Mameliella alba]MBY6175901.1 tRNA (N6-threonylcarbamoyladenosine(37)-N6)-methyltransferase TrmO [Mameliella alba]
MSTSVHRDQIRPGETAAEFPAASDAGLRFIGRIETPFHVRADCPRQGDPDHGPECQVMLDPVYAPALDGIEQFDQIELLYWLHEARRDLLTQSPKADGQTRGTFSLRSPLRPNPIGTSMVRLLARDGPVLRVRGLDCLNGTPLLDIKPYRCSYAVQARAKPGVST